MRTDPKSKVRLDSTGLEKTKPTVDALNELIEAYVEAVDQREFGAQARCQSKLILDSPEETEIVRWIKDVSIGVEVLE